MRHPDTPALPSDAGSLQFFGLSVRDAARIAALHGLLVKGTSLEAEAAGEYARRAADALFTEEERDGERPMDLERFLDKPAEKAASPRCKWWRPW